MVRIVKEHTVRRNEILDVAQQLVYTKGYEQMTIQDILDYLQISKGAFYHYFDSKQALLEALIERMLDKAEEQLLIPIVYDPHLRAFEKLERFFATMNRWKIAQKDFFLALLRVWYTDDNAILRQKMLISGAKRIIPLLTAIIHHGIEEGVLTTSYPDQVGGVVFSIIQGLGDTLAGLLLSFDPERDELRHMQDTVAAYTDALERVLGAPRASLQLIDNETLKAWFVSQGDDAQERSMTVSEYAHASGTDVAEATARL